MSRLLDAARSLHQTLDPSRLLVRVCEEATRVVGGERADVFLGTPSEGLRLEATYGRPGEAVGARLEPGDGIVAEVAERGEPVRAKRSLAAPLRWDGELHGVVAVEFGRERPGGDAQLELLIELAGLAAAAYRNATAHAQLALEARTDGLTGCLNHAAMHDTLRRELERCRRIGHGVSLAIVDLDDFKQVNEEHGHLAGDEVLRRVGAALRESVRAYDVVARYGGDEFAIILIDADQSTAADVASRALDGIERALRRLGIADDATAATAGVAEWSPGDSPTMLIAHADEALLYGKQQGSRGTAVPASSVPPGFAPERSGRR
ncbi:MAG TPA: sensor domain-containing diguanylate cyclase [Thermoleophilaceae bacterium]|nr:sensor domain-containing diguanylate cyclase [Thermoleophilaceae bacterium]